MSEVSIIIPTFNNPQYLYPCIQSLKSAMSLDLAEVIIVNNGDKDSIKVNSSTIRVINAGKNLGWEGGLKLGLQHTDKPYVCFLNDDTFFPISSTFWLHQLMQHLKNPLVAAVGPSSNYILGAQNIWTPTNAPYFEVTFLIGLCFLIKRKDLDDAGGIDDSLPGGDDIDLSIRLRKMGKKLVADRNVFVYHHHSTTGRRVRGDWDSVKHREAYNKALWEKHTLKELLYTYGHQILSVSQDIVDAEGDICRKWIQGTSIFELGCGDQRTVNGAVGIDIVPRGSRMGGIINRISDSDICANVFEPLPFSNADTIIARHILEHTTNFLNTLTYWRDGLKHGGRLIIAVPDEERGDMIPLNPQHKVSFTKDSLNQFAEIAGLKHISTQDSGNGISFVSVFERNGI